MKTTPTKIQGVLIIEPDVFKDERGWFFESYNKKRLEQENIFVDFVQDSHSRNNKRGILRGLHIQINPKAQAKLVRCTLGEILDIVVDLRKGSPTYKQWLSINLSADSKKQLFIPKGVAHGFITLTDHTEIQYKLDEFYSPEHERTIFYDDPELAINWKNDNPLLSRKDETAPLLKDTDIKFN